MQKQICCFGYCGSSQTVIMRYLLWYYRLIALGNRNKLAWFILHATTIHLTTLRTSVRESLQMHFKLVAVRSFHAFIQAGNSLTDVKGHALSACRMYLCLFGCLVQL